MSTYLIRRIPLSRFKKDYLHRYRREFAILLFKRHSIQECPRVILAPVFCTCICGYFVHDVYIPKGFAKFLSTGGGIDE
ncbi:hypothetical protein C5167_048607 [Papaver somniferum]|uniref:Uncharacterized protein n=1 Tax=Papaver somniferum TaxID=3469 RepID=A0A4Y7KJT7_PAPSO|nr:hypothetical protein C5167_048607 [Papaver somniferum]